MRVEGDVWVAYFALPDTMDGAIELGRIAMAIVTGPDAFERKQQFMAIMRSAISDILEARSGVRPVWPEPEGRPAPQRERAGRA